MTAQEEKALPEWLDVSRETLDLLERFAGLVEKWNPAINLVSKRSVPEIWQRHILDSAQLFFLIPKSARYLVDLGSGGGFPGIVLAIMARDVFPDLRMTLVEADQRKATFLSEAVRQLALRAEVVTERIEVFPPQHADVVTARALAPLATLCAHLHRHLGSNGLALLAKGANVDYELAEARLAWSFTLRQFVSKSDEEAKILAITDLRHV